MNHTPPTQTPDPESVQALIPVDPEHEELKKQVLAHVREFGPRKYLAFYKQAKNLKESGVDPNTVRKSLVFDLPKLPPPPEGGVHFISKVQNAKQQAIYHVGHSAVEDAIANRPPLFKEEHAKLG